MPSFKPKSNKKIKFNKKSSVTLDGKHKEFLNEFSIDETDKIPCLKQEQKELEERLNTTLTIEQKLDIADRIKEIKSTIKELKIKKKDYFLNNSKYIFDYFENKKNISDSSNINSTNSSTSKSKLVNTFFKIKKNEDEPTVTNNNTNIVQKYLCNIDENFLDVNAYVFQTDICKYCNSGELIPLEDEGILICNTCFRNIPYLIENEKPSY